MKRVITLLALAGWAGAAFLPTAFAAAEIGQPAPDFTATDIHGKTVKLSDYKGKVVVLESYNIECPFCANHFKTGAMQELQKDLTGQGVPRRPHFISISLKRRSTALSISFGSMYRMTPLVSST